MQEEHFFFVGLLDIETMNKVTTPKQQHFIEDRHTRILFSTKHIQSRDDFLGSCVIAVVLVAVCLLFF